MNPSIKELLKEASDMLKSFHSSPTTSRTSSPSSASSPQERERKDVMERFQQQLNMLKQKTFRLKRIQKGEREGLLDSGATRPLHPSQEGENIEVKHTRRCKLRWLMAKLRPLPSVEGEQWSQFK